MIQFMSGVLLLMLLPAGVASTRQGGRNKNIVALEAAIKGKESMPSEQVFKNVQTLKGMPAGRLLRVMEFAFTPALGVECEHCHNESKWESDEKPEKDIARKMWKMQLEVSEQVKGIVNKENAAVNCTTCHRGDVHPALNLPGERRSRG